METAFTVTSAIRAGRLSPWSWLGHGYCGYDARHAWITASIFPQLASWARETPTMPRQDYSHEVKKPHTLGLRPLFAGLGAAFTALGVAGIFLPMLPATPFLLLAAACFARASTRIYNWLLNHALLGPVILEWRRHQAIPYRTKIVAIALMALSMTASMVFFLDDGRVRLAMGVGGLVLAVLLWRIPSRDAPQRFSHNEKE